jgi:hypothetical protein
VSKRANIEMDKFLHRHTRRFVWERPTLYWPLGLLRARGNVLFEDYDFCVDGFPRSANTYALRMFQLMYEPNLRIWSHHHIPPFLIRAVQIGKPVFFLCRSPIDGAISYAILLGSTVEDQLRYYIQFHQVLLPYMDGLFVAPFDQVTSDFQRVVEAFAARWSLSLTPRLGEEIARSRAFAKIDEDQTNSLGGINERIVHRPSRFRETLRPALLASLDSSTAQRLLAEANDLYQQYYQSAKWRLASKTAATNTPSDAA